MIDFSVGCEGLEALQSENAQYVTKLSQLVLQETDREKTRLYANLILSQGYIRVVIEEMIEEGQFYIYYQYCETFIW